MNTLNPTHAKRWKKRADDKIAATLAASGISTETRTVVVPKSILDAQNKEMLQREFNTFVEEVSANRAKMQESFEAAMQRADRYWKTEHDPNASIYDYELFCNNKAFRRTVGAINREPEKTKNRLNYFLNNGTTLTSSDGKMFYFLGNNRLMRKVAAEEYCYFAKEGFFEEIDKFAKMARRKELGKPLQIYNDVFGKMGMRRAISELKEEASQTTYSAQYPMLHELMVDFFLRGFPAAHCFLYLKTEAPGDWDWLTANVFWEIHYAVRLEWRTKRKQMEEQFKVMLEDARASRRARGIASELASLDFYEAELRKIRTRIANFTDEDMETKAIAYASLIKQSVEMEERVSYLTGRQSEMKITDVLATRQGILHIEHNFAQAIEDRSAKIKTFDQNGQMIIPAAASELVSFLPPVR